MLFLLFVLGFAIGMHSEVRTDESYAAAMTAPTPTATSSSPVDLTQAAAAAGYDAALTRRLEHAELPSVVLETGRGASRIGGDPDLPRGTAWPTCHGRPQTFLAEIRVSELPREARELRRLGGTLLFFTQVEPGKAWAGDCSAVIHAQSGLVRTKPPSKTVRLHPRQLGLRLRQDIPGPKLDDDYAMPPLADVVANDTYTNLRESLGADTEISQRLLGYPDAPNGGNACWARAERAHDTWRHLFTLNWDDDSGFEIADAGRVQMLISPADLKAGRFDRVCGVFDSA